MVLEGRKTMELAEHEKQWNQARDRLTPKPAPAPVFDMMGGPPPRNLARDYDELRRGYEAGRAGIAARHDEGIAACAAERAEKLLAIRRGQHGPRRGTQKQPARARPPPQGDVREAGETRARPRRPLDEPPFQPSQPRRPFTRPVRRPCTRIRIPFPAAAWPCSCF